MSRFDQPILFDTSIGEWRFRTKADDDYAKAVIKEAFPNVTKEPLKELLTKLNKEGKG